MFIEDVSSLLVKHVLLLVQEVLVFSSLKEASDKPKTLSLLVKQNFKNCASLEMQVLAKCLQINYIGIQISMKRDNFCSLPISTTSYT